MDKLEPDSDDEPQTDPSSLRSRLFPPELIPLLRERLGTGQESLVGVGDELLAELLSVAFFAGLQAHEGTHYPVRLAFSGRNTGDVVLSDGGAPDATPMLFYRWSTLRMDPCRPYCVSELVKLGVVTRSDRMYIKIELTDQGLRIAGLAREGLNHEGDPYLKVLAPRPGVLSFRRGRERLLEVEGGKIDAGQEDVVRTSGVVRRALEKTAQSAGLGTAAIGDYLDTVRSLVRVMAAHGKGGILVINGEESPALPPKASYRTHDGCAITKLLHYFDGAAGARRSGGAPSPSSPSGATMQLRSVLRSSFLSEAERWVTELGGFTAMDGATVFDSALGLRGFGVVLPVARDVDVVRAIDAEATTLEAYDLSTRGTRHRAAVTYAMLYPGSVVFVASHDGPVACLVGDPARSRVVLWRLGSGGFL